MENKHRLPQESVESYHYLYSRVYMGHACTDAEGKNLTWQKLRDLSEEDPSKRLRVRKTQTSDGLSIHYQLL